MSQKSSKKVYNWCVACGGRLEEKQVRHTDKDCIAYLANLVGTLMCRVEELELREYDRD